MPDDRSRPDDAALFTTSAFHEWWLEELRSSVAPSEIDVPPRQPEPEPARHGVPHSVVFFACALGLVGGAATMALLDTHASAAHARPQPHALAQPSPVVEGIVEIGEIIQVSSPGKPERDASAPPPKAKKKKGTAKSRPKQPLPARPVAAAEPEAPFDSAAARSAVASAAASAASCGDGAYRGPTRVAITFAPSGRATSAVLEGGSKLLGTLAGSCVAQRMRSVGVPPFDGRHVTVHTTVTVR